MSPVAIFFTYLIGALFAVGGLLFMLFLEENRFLFGIPYLVIGLVLLYGTYGVRKRARRRGDAGGGGHH